MFICFGGVVTITISGSKNAKEAVEVSNYPRELFISGIILSFVLAWLWSVNTILNRALKGIHSGIIMFWHGVLGMMLAIMAVGIHYGVTDDGTGNGL